MSATKKIEIKSTTKPRSRVNGGGVSITNHKTNVKGTTDNREITLNSSIKKTNNEINRLPTKSGLLQSEQSKISEKKYQKIITKQMKNIQKDRGDDKKLLTREKTQTIKLKSTKIKPTSSGNLSSNQKPNLVLDTYHNVTISSPSTKRKEHRSSITRTSITTTPSKEGMKPILKGNQSEIQTKASVSFEVNFPKTTNNTIENIEKKLKFDRRITKEQDNTSKDLDKNKIESNSCTVTTKVNSEEDKTEEDSLANYSDDFESYESDFETELSTTDTSESQLSPRNTSLLSEETTTTTTIKNNDEEENDDDEESDLTQNPITVIQRHQEQKHDSGNYEIHTKKSQLMIVDQQDHLSLDTTSLISISGSVSEQWDSGISGYDTRPTINNKIIDIPSSNLRYFNDLKEHDSSPSPRLKIVFDGYKMFLEKPILTTRGLELMKKIQFDSLEFVFFDKPSTSYENFIQIYGKSNTKQNSTQTRDNFMDMDIQTDEIDYRCVWTQYPGFYQCKTNSEIQKSLQLHDNIQCVDEDEEYNINFLKNKTQKEYMENNVNVFETSLKYWSKLRRESDQRKCIRNLKKTPANLNVEKLNRFLLRSSLLMTQMLQDKGSETNDSISKQSFFMVKGVEQLHEITETHYTLNVNYLNSLKVTRIFSNNQYDLLLTVHESLKEIDVYRMDFANLIMIWSLSLHLSPTTTTTNRNQEKPIRLLSSWSEINHLEISNRPLDVIVAGLRDGTIAMWDLCETYTFCSKLDGEMIYFTPTQTILPNYGENSTLKRDHGACLDIRTFRPSNTILTSFGGRQQSQFVSLHESGLVTIWTLVEASMIAQRNSNTSLDYTSPWARVKLTQSSIIQLYDYLTGGKQLSVMGNNQFSQTKELFENNIYNDKILEELKSKNERWKDRQHKSLNSSNSIHYVLDSMSNLNGLRFNCLDVGCETIYICCNRNFLLICTKSLQKERIRQIHLQDNHFLFPTTLKVLSNEFYVAIGYSNGEVILINCNKQKLSRNRQGSQNTESSSKSTFLNDKSVDKSCTIQNIILNVDYDQQQHLEKEIDGTIKIKSRPNTAAIDVALVQNQLKPYELRLEYEQQWLILSGSNLRQNLVQTLELSSDGWRLFALSNGRIRVYDFFQDQELQTKDNILKSNLFHLNENSNLKIDKKDANCNEEIIDLVATNLSIKDNLLILLKHDTTIDIHLLKK